MYNNITKEQIEAELRKLPMPYVKHHTEGGISMWEIFDGENSTFTGDGGMKMFDEAMQKEAKKYIEENPPFGFGHDQNSEFFNPKNNEQQNENK